MKLLFMQQGILAYSKLWINMRVLDKTILDKNEITTRLVTAISFHYQLCTLHNCIAVLLQDQHCRFVYTSITIKTGLMHFPSLPCDITRQWELFGYFVTPSLPHVWPNRPTVLWDRTIIQNLYLIKRNYQTNQNWEILTKQMTDILPKKQRQKRRKITQLLRAHVAFEKDSSLILNTHIRRLTINCNSSSKGSDISGFHERCAHVQCAGKGTLIHTHTFRNKIHLKNKDKDKNGRT